MKLGKGTRDKKDRDLQTNGIQRLADRKTCRKTKQTRTEECHSRLAAMASPRMTGTDHVKLAVRVGEGGDGEGDDTAGSQGQVGVDDGSVLSILHGQGAVKTGPEQPQEDGACNATRYTNTRQSSRARLSETDTCGTGGKLASLTLSNNHLAT